MLSILILQLFITILAVSSGFILYAILGIDPQDKNESISNRPLINYFLSGLTVIATLVQLLQIVVPLNGFSLLVLVSLIIISLVLCRKQFPQFLTHVKEAFLHIHPLTLTGIIIAGTMIALMASGPIIQDDSESYHMQIIQWSKLHSAVPGIANLHIRYGFQSSWFSLIAIFLPEIGKVNFFAVLNSLVCFWFTAYCFNLILPKLKENRNLVLSLAILFILVINILMWPLLRGSSANTNYDMITTVVIITLAIQLVQYLSFKKSFPFVLEWIVWPFFLITIRIINFPFLILALFGWCLLWRQKNIVT